MKCQLEYIYLTMDEIRLQPKQEEFLSASADIVIGGGAAGGGKSFALTVEPLRHVNVFGFNSVIFRRTYPEVMHPGGLWDEAMGIYPFLGGNPKQQRSTFVFPKSKMSYGYLLNENSLMNWKSSQISLVMFDQLEMFTERMLFYMLSRNRSKCAVKSYMRATANPEPNWLAEFLSWWIAPDGYADMDRAGKERAFVRDGDNIVWGDSKAELKDSHPALEPKTVTFIPFTIFDNPILMEKDPGYLASLQALPYVDRERLLGDRVRGGNWKVKPSAGKVFNRDWFELVDTVPDGGIVCRYFDFAATAKTSFKDDPDYTAGVCMLYADKNWYIIDVYNMQIGAAVTDKIVDEIFIRDAEKYMLEGRRYLARWEIEPGSASLRDSVARVNRLAGIDAKGVQKRTDKLTAWKPLSAQTEAGHVKVLKANWNDVLLNQLHGVPDLPHDDMADAVSGAYSVLVRESGQKQATYHRG